MPMDVSQDERPMAFVIMPFGEEFDRIFKQCIVPPLASAGYHSIRADTQLNQRFILKDIVEGLMKADLVVADITAFNSNVLYELGIAHALGKKTVLIVQEDDLESVPFDLKGYRFVVYSTRFDQIQEFVDELTRIAAGALQGTIEFGNPVTDFGGVSERMIDKVQPSDEIGGVQGSDEDEDEDEDDTGLLDFMVEAQDSLSDINQRTERMTEKAKLLAERTTRRNKVMGSLKNSIKAGTASKMRKEAMGMARDIEEYTKAIRKELPGLHDSWMAFEQGFIAWYLRVKESTPEDPQTLVVFRTKTQRFRDAMTGAIRGTQSAGDGLLSLKGYTRELTRASRRSAQTHEALMDEFEIGQSVLDRVLALIDQHLEESAT